MSTQDQNDASTSGNAIISVATYNIHRAMGTDKQYDPHRIVEVIKELDVDILGLQEVDSCLRAEEQMNQVVYFSHATGYKAIVGPTILEHTGHYGNVLLTRHKIVGVRRIDLSVFRVEPRGALDIDIEVRGTPVRVLVSHFGLQGYERRIQVARLLDILSTSDGRLVIMLADFNEWVPFARSFKRIQRLLSPSPAFRTYPSTFPLFALDRIFVSDPDALETVMVYISPLTRLASDHLPLKALIKVPSKTSSGVKEETVKELGS